MLYKNIFFEKSENGISFGNERLTLVFKADGELAELNLTDKSFALDRPEVSVTIGGEYRSTLDYEHINKNWASLKLFGAETLSPESEYLSHSLAKTADAVELRLRVRLGQLEMTKIYTLRSGRPGFARSFELKNIGESVNIRSVGLAFPKSEGWSACQIPAAPRMLTDGERCFAAWFDPRYESCQLGGGLGYAVNVENRLDTGEIVASGRVEYELFDCAPAPAARAVSKRIEALGLRAHREKERMLRGLVCYEVEIGPLRLSEEKCHHRYDHPEELANDLERIKALGFNTVELMPSFLFPCYTVYDLKNPDIQHGAGESIRPIIRRAHELGMKVILDILMHGCIDTEIADFDREHYCSRRYYWPEWQKKIPELVGDERARANPLRAEHPDWFIYEKPGEIFKGYTWTFDHANPGFQEYFAEAMVISVLDWGVDGFRFDAPNWQCGVNSAENLPYSGGESLNHGHCELFRKMRERVDGVRDDIIFIVEGPYYQYADSCDISYAYDLYYQMKNIFEGKSDAASLQRYCEMRQAIFPDGALWLNFADNHDTWNNGVIEDGLYSYERFGEAAKAMFALACFADGGVQAFGGYEENAEFADYTRKLLARRAGLSEFICGCTADYSVYPSDKRLFCAVRRSSELSETLWFIVNLSGDEVNCESDKLGSVTFKPYEAKLWRNMEEISL